MYVVFLNIYIYIRKLFMGGGFGFFFMRCPHFFRMIKCFSGGGKWGRMKDMGSERKTPAGSAAAHLHDLPWIACVWDYGTSTSKWMGRQITSPCCTTWHRILINHAKKKHHPNFLFQLIVLPAYLMSKYINIYVYIFIYFFFNLFFF